MLYVLLRVVCRETGSVVSGSFSFSSESERSGKAPGIRCAKDRSYVGRRLMNLPSEGTKREFWTFVMEDKVATSGSIAES